MFSFKNAKEAPQFFFGREEKKIQQPKTQFFEGKCEVIFLQTKRLVGKKLTEGVAERVKNLPSHRRKTKTYINKKTMGWGLRERFFSFSHFFFFIIVLFHFSLKKGFLLTAELNLKLKLLLF